MDGEPSRFESLLPLLLGEEQTLNALVDAAGRLGHALVVPDYDAILLISEELTALSAGMERLERNRVALTGELGFAAEAALSAIADAAEAEGTTVLRVIRERMLARARELQTIQERNAALVLSAVRLRDRWVNLLAGMMTGTYSSGGRAEMQQDRRIVSKSA
jgi:hypothetical protein